MDRRLFVLAAPIMLATVSMARAEADVLADAFDRLPAAGKLAAQEKLAAGGFYAGTPDGAFGPKTKAALTNAAVFITNNSYGKVVFDLTTADGADRFLAALAKGELDKYLWGEGDESDGG